MIGKFLRKISEMMVEEEKNKNEVEERTCLDFYMEQRKRPNGYIRPSARLYPILAWFPCCIYPYINV